MTINAFTQNGDKLLDKDFKIIVVGDHPDCALQNLFMILSNSVTYNANDVSQQLACSVLFIHLVARSALTSLMKTLVFFKTYSIESIVQTSIDLFCEFYGCKI